MPVGNSEQSQIIAFTQKGIGRRHVTARNHRTTTNRQEINDHKGDEKNR